ncbi:ABC transporter permease [Pseudothermotoga sp. U03pept]|uniref:ABC transporter permease n=1 Tax=Pseudothermotoga sp. U03pept TaxID=3447012 RepID=UPI003F077A16
MKRYLLLVPALIFLFIFFVLPLLAVLAESVYQPGKGWVFGKYLQFFTQRVSRVAYFRSLWMGLLVVAASVAIGYPAATAIVNVKSDSLKSLLLTLVVFPQMTNPVARTFSWLAVLGREGMVNNLLTSLKITSEPVRLLYTPGAVFLGLLQLFLPLMIISLTSALENMPKDVPLAAKSLGASGFHLFTKIYLPLTSEGIVSGCTLVFTGCITAYVTPAVLGGSRVLMLSTLLFQKASVTLDWNMATVIAVVMFLTTLAVNYGSRIVTKAGVKK